MLLRKCLDNFQLLQSTIFMPLRFNIIDRLCIKIFGHLTAIRMNILRLQIPRDITIYSTWYINFNTYQYTIRRNNHFKYVLRTEKYAWLSKVNLFRTKNKKKKKNWRVNDKRAWTWLAYSPGIGFIGVIDWARGNADKRIITAMKIIGATGCLYRAGTPPVQCGRGAGS